MLPSDLEPRESPPTTDSATDPQLWQAPRSGGLDRRGGPGASGRARWRPGGPAGERRATPAAPRVGAREDRRAAARPPSVQASLDDSRPSAIDADRPTCGSIRVYWGSTLLKTISLKSAKTVNKKLITVVAWPAPKTGTLTIKVASSGKKVIIDGVAIRRT
jgi:hypothetical protein